MDYFKIVCPNPQCGATLTARTEHIGEMGRCKRCGVKFRLSRQLAGGDRRREAVRILAEAENLYQDNSGLGESEWGDALVSLAPESIRAISQRGWKKRGIAENTNEFLVRVLGRIAAEGKAEEGKQAIMELQRILGLPDDNTTGHMYVRGASIHELAKLDALPGVEARDSRSSAEVRPFRLDPIEPGDIGPLGAKPPDEKPNLESASIWQLVLYPAQDDQQVLRRFEANYSRWKKTFDRPSHSLVLNAYGCSLQSQGRLREAVLALRWACKLYPYRGYGACDALPGLEAQVRDSAPMESADPASD